MLEEFCQTEGWNSGFWKDGIQLTVGVRWRKIGVMSKSGSLMIRAMLKANNTIEFASIVLVYMTIFVNFTPFVFLYFGLYCRWKY